MVCHQGGSRSEYAAILCHCLRIIVFGGVYFRQSFICVADSFRGEESAAGNIPSDVDRDGSTTLLLKPGA